MRTMWLWLYKRGLRQPALPTQPSSASATQSQAITRALPASFRGQASSSASASSMASRSALIALLVAVSCAAVASAATYTVGESQGWSLGVNYDNWASGKTFAVGDKLVFQYTTGSHDVLEVSKSDYDSCNTGNALSSNTNGPTTITLNSAGAKYYICGIGTHCSNGMKLAVTVGSGGAAPSPSTPSTPGTPPTTPSTPSAPSPKNAAPARYTAAPALAVAAGVLLKLALF